MNDGKDRVSLPGQLETVFTVLRSLRNVGAVILCWGAFTIVVAALALAGVDGFTQHTPDVVAVLVGLALIALGCGIWWQALRLIGEAKVEVAAMEAGKREGRVAENPAEPRPRRHLHVRVYARPSTGTDDEAALRALAGVHFGPDANVTLPTGRTISGDEAQALTSFYAPDAESPEGEVRGS